MNYDVLAAHENNIVINNTIGRPSIITNDLLERINIIIIADGTIDDQYVCQILQRGGINVSSWNVNKCRHISKFKYRNKIKIR